MKTKNKTLSRISESKFSLNCLVSSPKALLLILLVVLHYCTGCKTDPPEPDYIPGYYFYCKVDGVEFKPIFKSELGYKNIETKLLNGDSLLTFHADLLNQRISLGVYDYSNRIILNTPYLLTNNSTLNVGVFDNNLQSIDWYITDTTHTGQVTITSLDKSKQLVQGTFYFDAYNDATQDTVHITDGVFNLYYQTY